MKPTPSTNLSSTNSSTQYAATSISSQLMRGYLAFEETLLSEGASAIELFAIRRGILADSHMNCLTLLASDAIDERAKAPRNTIEDYLSGSFSLSLSALSN
jgi:hypothetical protein